MWVHAPAMITGVSVPKKTKFASLLLHEMAELRTGPEFGIFHREAAVHIILRKTPRGECPG